MNIIHEDEKILVTNKLAGVTSENFAKRMANEIKKLKKLPRNGLAHRIDKDTSGILLFGKSKEILESLKEKFKNREVKKKYICLVWRSFKDKKGEIITSMRRGSDFRKHQSYQKAEEGRRAISIYKVLENFENYSLIEVMPKTGRRHQIRSQMAYLGHPLVGDSLYGFKDQKDPVKMNRHFLHNRFLELKVNNKKKRFESDLPEELKRVLSKLKQDNV